MKIYSQKTMANACTLVMCSPPEGGLPGRDGRDGREGPRGEISSLEKEMATHSSVLAWRIPGMGEPGGLPSMGSHRVRHD